MIWIVSCFNDQVTTALTATRRKCWAWSIASPTGILHWTPILDAWAPTGDWSSALDGWPTGAILVGVHLTTSSFSVTAARRLPLQLRSARWTWSIPNQASLIWEKKDQSFRAVSEQFQSSFRAISEQFQSNFRAVSEQFQSNFRAVRNFLLFIDKNIFFQLFFFNRRNIFFFFCWCCCCCEGGWRWKLDDWCWPLDTGKCESVRQRSF